MPQKAWLLVNAANAALAIFCAWCKARRLVNGEWHDCSREEYDAALTTATHWLCPSCAPSVRRNLRARIAWPGAMTAEVDL